MLQIEAERHKNMLITDRFYAFCRELDPIIIVLED